MGKIVCSGSSVSAAFIHSIPLWSYLAEKKPATRLVLENACPSWAMQVCDGCDVAVLHNNARYVRAAGVPHIATAHSTDLILPCSTLL